MERLKAPWLWVRALGYIPVDINNNQTEMI